MGNSAGKKSSKRRSHIYDVANSRRSFKKNQNPHEKESSDRVASFYKAARQLDKSPELLTFDHLPARATEAESAKSLPGDQGGAPRPVRRMPEQTVPCSFSKSESDLTDSDNHITPYISRDDYCSDSELLNSLSSSDESVTNDSDEVPDIDSHEATGKDSDGRSLDLPVIDSDENEALKKTTHFVTAKKRAKSVSELLQAPSQHAPQREEKALSQLPPSISHSMEFTGSPDKGLAFDALITVTKQASRYQQLRENYNVLHLLVYGCREQELRREQYESYATVHPLINTLDSKSQDSNAVMVPVEEKRTLFLILEHFMKISVRRNKHLETLFIVFNSHGHSDGTLELSDKKPGVHMNEIITFVHKCRTEQMASDVSNTVELHLVFGQCYAHSFDLHFAAQCDKITDIWWFTSEKHPKTLNLRSEMDRLEHSELMRFARCPWKQNNLQSMRKQLELDKSKEVGQELRNTIDQLEKTPTASALPRYAATFLHPGYLLLISNSKCQFHDDLPQNHTDATSLRDAFTRSLKYSFSLHEHITAQEIKRELTQLARDVDKKSYYCFVVVILSHGCTRGALGTDGECVSEDFIVQTLGRSKFMEGKPKLILVQSCRFVEDAKMDPTPKLKTLESDVSTKTHKIDDDKAFVGLDMIIARSTFSGKMLRDPTHGSTNFIQSFARHATQFAWSCDVNTILKMVTQDVVSKSSLRGRLCIPYISYNTLRKHFYLA